MRFKIKWLNHIKMGYLALIYIAFYLFFIYPDFEHKEFVPLALVSLPLIVFVFPVLFIHVQYFINDFNKEFELNYPDSELIIFGNQDLKIPFKEINKIELHKRNMEGDGGISWFPWDQYSYVQVFYSENKSVKITCLSYGKNFPIPLEVLIINRPLPYFKK